MIRIDLAADLTDEAAVLSGYSMLTSDSKRPAPTGRLSAAALIERAVPAARLDDVEIADANLRSRDLGHTSWQRAVLVDCDFDRSVLVAADFTEAKIDQVSFRECILSEANFFGADLVSSFLERASLVGADFRGAVISNCELDGVVARSANFESALLEDSRLVGADLSRARVTETTTLRRCDLTGACLDGVELAKATVIDCKF